MMRLHMRNSAETGKQQGQAIDFGLKEQSESMKAGDRVLTYSPLKPMAQNQLPVAALSSLTKATILSGSVECDAMATDVEDYE